MPVNSRLFGRAAAAAAVISVLAVPAAGAAPSSHLSAAAWRAFVSLHAITRPSVAQCASVAATDEEASGIHSICVDAAGVHVAIARTASGCYPTIEAACGADLLAADRFLSSSAAWAGWLAERLASGGCRSFFSGLGNAEAALARSGDRFAAALRAHESPSQLQSSNRAWLQAGHAWNVKFYASSGSLDLAAACNPAA